MIHKKKYNQKCPFCSNQFFISQDFDKNSKKEKIIIASF